MPRKVCGITVVRSDGTVAHGILTGADVSGIWVAEPDQLPVHHGWSAILSITIEPSDD